MIFDSRETLAPTSDLLPHLQAISNPRGYSYLVSRPPDPTGNSASALPALLSLHGTRERGSRIEDVGNQGVPRLLAGSAELTPAERAIGQEIAGRFVVIAPQCPAHETWDEQALLRLLEIVQRELPIDSARIYLTGMSMGAFGAWTLALRSPRQFAAVLPICGGGRLTDIAAAMATDAAALRSMGVWAFHGAKDRVVPLEESERMVAELQRVGVADARLTVYPEAEHNSWSQTYSNPEIYRWLLEHKR